MAIVKRDRIRVAKTEGGRIALRLPIGGQERTVMLDAADALSIGNDLAHAGADNLPSPAGLPRLGSVRIEPFDDSGVAFLQLAFEGYGPTLTFALDNDRLRAISQAASAALEFAKTSGSA